MGVKARIMLVLLCLPILGWAQSPHPILNSLEAFKQPNGILVKWVIAGGGQCQGTKIFRSLDETNYAQIGHIAGICGSVDFDQTYTYFDSVPEPNTYNHYRLEMGFQGFTTIVSVFYEDFGNQQYSLLSDYQNESFKILYSNDLKNTAILEIYDHLGNAIYGGTSTNSDIEFKTTGWKSGVYIFRIFGVGKADLKGKFYIGAQ